ncbi:hypothetical protein J6590_040355 [Homalodisca vitripennis]|nr:hypothetical protein J6590_040355 [Homalodisca vitripennis]
MTNITYKPEQAFREALAHPSHLCIALALKAGSNWFVNVYKLNAHLAASSHLDITSTVFVDLDHIIVCPDLAVPRGSSNNYSEHQHFCSVDLATLITYYFAINLAIKRLDCRPRSRQTSTPPDFDDVRYVTRKSYVSLTVLSAEIKSHDPQEIRNYFSRTSPRLGQ